MEDCCTVAIYGAPVLRFTVSIPGRSRFMNPQPWKRLLLVVLLGGFFTSASFGATDGPAELPRVYVNSSMAATPAPGAKVTVASGANLQTALKNAHCGDTLLLQAGATFTGSYYLPAKPCDDNHWIVIRTSAPDSALPPEGTRITPCYSGITSLPGRPALHCTTTQKVMARIVASNAGPIALINGSSHYRIGPGLEITRPVSTWMYYGLIATSATFADHIVIDRDWIHGVPQNDTTRGVMLSGVTYAAVVDSYLNDFHCGSLIGKCIDAQAIAGGTGSNPQGIWKIHNNFLEAAAENILFGGTFTNSVTPADIEITHNHMFKPLTWMPGQPGFVGEPNTDTTKCKSTPGQCPFIVKNLFEIKNAQRVLFEGNLLEHSWPGFSQHGASILIGGENVGNNTNNSYISVMDVTIRYNRASHTASGLSITNPAFSATVPNLPIARFSVHDDVFDDISPAYQNGDTSGAFATVFTYCPVTLGCTIAKSIVINHITELITQPTKWFVIVSAPAPIQNWLFTNSIVSVNPGLMVNNAMASGCAVGPTNLIRIANCFGPYVMTRNALIGGTGTWPSGNLLPASATAVGFVNYNNANGGDYTLRSTSPYHDKGTDGKDLGADISAVNTHTQGVE
jgi:hypothetical protein